MKYKEINTPTETKEVIETFSDKVKRLVNEYPNDKDLGKHIRKLVTNG